MTNSQKLLNPEIINKISSLELKAQQIIEGFLWGKHKSPYRGVSIEFAQHREYTWGDDLRHLDWKVYGRSDKLFIKEYEQETNLNAYILLDTSESMAFGDKISKYDYSSILAASLSYLLLAQQDATGLFLFTNKGKKYLSPKANKAFLNAIITEIVLHPPAEPTNFKDVLFEISEHLTKKSMILLFSDLLGDINEIKKGLQLLRSKGNDVSVFHILDPSENSFPFNKMMKFDGLEIETSLIADSKALRKAYLEEVTYFKTKISDICTSSNIDYKFITTDQPPDTILSNYLTTRIGRA